MNDFKRLAERVVHLVDEETHPREYSLVCEIRDILTTLAAVSEDEPERHETYYSGSSIFDRARVQTSAEYADWQRNGRLRAEIGIKRLRELLSWANDKCNDCENGPELRAENEQLRAQLADLRGEV